MTTEPIRNHSSRAPTLLRTIFEQPGPASVLSQHAHAAAALEAKLPAAIDGILGFFREGRCFSNTAVGVS